MNNQLAEIESLIQLTKDEPGFVDSRKALKWAVAEIKRMHIELNTQINVLPQTISYNLNEAVKAKDAYIVRLEARLRIMLADEYMEHDLSDGPYNEEKEQAYVDAEMAKLREGK